jgi:cell division protein ZapD
VICYEFPLSERIRTFLRVDDLYDRAEFFAGKEEAPNHHAAMQVIFEILDVSGRADLKSELMQDLERLKQALGTLRTNPAISEDALAELLTQIEQATSNLFLASGKTGQELRENEWLMGIKQRAAIPGGVCEFDLPTYHYWLHGSAQQRQQDLHAWLAPFQPLRAGINIVLRILRDSGRGSMQTATQGVFQQMMGGRTAQLIRIKVDDRYDCVPEVSANKYALNIRFTLASSAARAKLALTDVPFELTFCNFPDGWTR